MLCKNRKGFNSKSTPVPSKIALFAKNLQPTLLRAGVLHHSMRCKALYYTSCTEYIIVSYVVVDVVVDCVIFDLVVVCKAEQQFSSERK